MLDAALASAQTLSDGGRLSISRDLGDVPSHPGRDTVDPVTSLIEWQRQEPSSRPSKLEVTTGDDVAFVHALLRCGSPSDLKKDPDSAFDSPSAYASTESA